MGICNATDNVCTDYGRQVIVPYIEQGAWWTHTQQSVFSINMYETNYGTKPMCFTGSVCTYAYINIMGNCWRLTQPPSPTCKQSGFDFWCWQERNGSWPLLPNRKDFLILIEVLVPLPWSCKISFYGRPSNMLGKQY